MNTHNAIDDIYRRHVGAFQATGDYTWCDITSIRFSLRLALMELAEQISDQAADQARIAALEANLEQLQTDIDAEVASYRAEIAEKQQAIAQLQQELDESHQHQQNADHIARNFTPDTNGATLSTTANDYRIGLSSGRWQWRNIPKTVQIEIVRSVIASLDQPTQEQFNACKPTWMPTGSSHCKTLNATWSDLADLTKEIEVRS